MLPTIDFLRNLHSMLCVQLTVHLDKRKRANLSSYDNLDDDSDDTLLRRRKCKDSSVPCKA